MTVFCLRMFSWLVLFLSVSGAVPLPSVHPDGAAMSEVRAAQGPAAPEFIRALRFSGERLLARGSVRGGVAARSHHVYGSLPSARYSVATSQLTTALIQQGAAFQPSRARTSIALRGPPTTI